MDKYYYKLYSDELKSDWQSVLQKSADAWMFHDIDLCLYLLRSQQPQNISLIIYNANANDPVAVCPLFLRKQHFRSFYDHDKIIAESFPDSGPAVIDKLSEKKRREVIRYIGDTIVATANTQKFDGCSIGSANLSMFCLQPDNAFTNPWHEMRGLWQNVAVPYYYLDLQQNENYLKSRLEAGAGTIVRKFEISTGCLIRKANAGDLDIIYNLFLDALGPAGLPSRPKDDFDWFLNHPNYLHYLTFIDGKPACAIRLVKYKDTGAYAADFTATDFIKTEITTYSLWECLLQMKKQNVVHFELGIEEFKPVGGKADDISKLKRSFGGELRYKFSMTYEKKNLIKKVAGKLLEIL